MSTISFRTVTLYGVLVTEESFLTAIHSHIKAKLDRDVLMKAVGTQVPGELFNEIMKDLNEKSRVTVGKVWHECFSQHERDAKFGSFSAGSVPTLQEIVASGVQATPVTRDTPFNINGPASNVAERFVHLSISKNQPISQEVLDQPSIPVSAGPVVGSGYICSRGTMDAAAMTETATPNNITDSITFIPDPTTGVIAGIPEQASRIIKLSGVVEAIRDWDEATIASFIKSLQLKVVPFDPRQPLKPELVQFQRIFYQ